MSTIDNQPTCFQPNPLASVIVTRPLRERFIYILVFSILNASPNLCLLLPDHELAEHVADTEDLREADLQRGQNITEIIWSLLLYPGPTARVGTRKSSFPARLWKVKDDLPCNISLCSHSSHLSGSIALICWLKTSRLNFSRLVALCFRKRELGKTVLWWNSLWNTWNDSCGVGSSSL